MYLERPGFCEVLRLHLLEVAIVVLEPDDVSLAFGRRVRMCVLWRCIHVRRRIHTYEEEDTCADDVSLAFGLA